MTHIRHLIQVLTLLLFTALGSASAWASPDGWQQVQHSAHSQNLNAGTPDMANAATGLVEIGTATYICGQSVGAACIPAAALGLHGLDTYATGLGQLISGEKHLTVGATFLMETLGLSETAATLIYDVAGITAEVGAIRLVVKSVLPVTRVIDNVGANRGVPDNWTRLNPAGAQINVPRGYKTYRTPDGDMVHVSPSGLQYGADPKFGNRVDHILDHTAPNPNKPVHSVFNAQGDDALRIVDDAWANRTGPGTLQTNGNRTWTVDLGRPIGTTGQTSVQIVVRDGTTEIITAFPK